MNNIDELCNLINGIKINNQHIYFKLAKEDIYELASQFYYNVKMLPYNNSKLQLPNYCKIIEYNQEQLQIVITYIQTYGLEYFRECLKNINPSELIFYEKDYEEYLSAYLREFDV
jgi:hypothetical protein